MALRARRRSNRERVGAVCAGVAAALCIATSASAADRFVYVSNGLGGSQNVSVMQIGANGALTAVSGSPFATGATTQEGLALTPDAQHLYVASFGTNAVMKFNVNATSGALSGLQAFNPGGTTFTTPLGVAPDPDGGHLFTWNHGSQVAVTTIDQATGGLTNVTGSPFGVVAGFTNPFAGSVSPDGDHLYVPFENTNPGGGAPDRSGVYSVAANGALTNIQTVITGGAAAADGNPFGSGVTPDGRFVYISAPEDLATVGDIYGFSVNPSGTLSAISGSPFPVTPGGSHPLTIAVSPDSTHLYVATRQTNAVKAYNIDQSSGALTAIGSFATGGSNGKSLALTPDGKRLYVANQLSNNISGFAVADNGSLSTLPGSPWLTGGTSPDLESIAITPNQGPTASFTTTPGFAGDPTGFNGNGSADTDGDVARYDWEFGDGTTLPDGGPIPNHIYTSPGTFTARLTVTDNEGCAATRIFTGKAMLCNASTAGTTTRQVTVAPAPPTPAPKNISRKLTIKYKSKKNLFKGKIKSNSADCIDSQKVTVFQKKNGTDPKFGTTTSAGNGKWKLKAKNADGKFYAKVGKSLLPDEDTCLAAQSKKAKVASKR